MSMLYQIRIKQLCRFIITRTITSDPYSAMDLKTKATHLDKLEILHKSDHFLVVNKDFDVVMNTEGG